MCVTFTPPTCVRVHVCMHLHVILNEFKFASIYMCACAYVSGTVQRAFPMNCELTGTEENDRWEMIRKDEKGMKKMVELS